MGVHHSYEQLADDCVKHGTAPSGFKLIIYRKDGTEYSVKSTNTGLTIGLINEILTVINDSEAHEELRNMLMAMNYSNSF